MGRTFSDSDFAPAQSRTFTDADFQDAPEQPGTAAQPLAPSGLRDAVSESTFSVAGRSQPAYGATPSYAPPLINPGENPNPVKALLTNEPVDDFYNKSVRGLPSMVGGATGSLLGPAVGTAMAAGGEGIRQGAVGLYAKATGGRVPSVGEAMSHMGEEGALNLFGLAAGKAIPLVPKAIGGAYGWAAKNMGGIGEQTLQTIKTSAGDVAERVGISREQIGSLGEKVRGAVSSAVQKGEDYYAKVAAKYSQPGSYGPDAPRLNFRDAVLPKIEQIGLEEGYKAPDETIRDSARGITMTFLGEGPRRISDAVQVEKFNEFRQLASELGEATPQQIYYFQKDINKAIRDFQGKPIVAALGKIKSAANEFIKSNGDKFPELVEGNKAYAAAMELEDDAAKMVNADDAIQYIKNAFNPGKYESQKRKTLEAIAARVPELGDAIKEVQLGTAAEESGRLFRSLPQTGFGAAMLTGAGAAAAKLPAALAAAPAFSPRAYLAGYQLAQSNVGQAAQSGLAAAYNAIPKPVIPLAANAAARYYVR